MALTAYKVTNSGAICIYGNGSWHKPRGKRPGKWMPKLTDLSVCSHGYHLCHEGDLVEWLGPEIWIAEYRGEVIESDNKIVVAQARLVRRVETWTEKTARLFAADCAEAVLPFFEKERPADNRPRLAIKAARDFANGKITSAAWAAASGAASDAAWAAARAAARDAARAAAWDARAAAWDARAAASDAAWDAARADQTKLLMGYLGERYRMGADR